MMTKALAQNGAAKIYIIGRRLAPLLAAASLAPGIIIPKQGDVTSKDSLAALVQEIKLESGYIDLLIANSGIIGPQPPPLPPLPPAPASTLSPASSGPALTLEEFQSQCWKAGFEEYARTFEVNVVGVWFTVIAFLALLDSGNRRRRDGVGGMMLGSSQVIATSSIGGFNRMTPGGFAYGQSKAAVTHLMKQLATGLVPWGIRANVIAPGRELLFHFFSSSFLFSILLPSNYHPLLFSFTPVSLRPSIPTISRDFGAGRMNEGIEFFWKEEELIRVVLFRSVYPSELAAHIIGDGVFPKDKIPAERVGTEEDMAGTVLYLASRAGAYCNGVVVVTDGGRLSVHPSTY